MQLDTVNTQSIIQPLHADRVSEQVAVRESPPSGIEPPVSPIVRAATGVRNGDKTNDVVGNNAEEQGERKLCDTDSAKRSEFHRK